MQKTFHLLPKIFSHRDAPIFPVSLPSAAIQTAVNAPWALYQDRTSSFLRRVSLKHLGKLKEESKRRRREVEGREQGSEVQLRQGGVGTQDVEAKMHRFTQHLEKRPHL